MTELEKYYRALENADRAGDVEAARGLAQTIQKLEASPPPAELRAYNPSALERAGNATFDFLKSVGLPASRMRRDNTNLDNLVRGAADVFTGGFSDEIVAGANAALGGNYESELEKQRAIDRSGGPARTVGQVVGGGALGIGMARRGLSPAFNVAKRGKGLGFVAGTSAAEGAALSGAYGFGSGEGGFQNRLETAAPAGLFGFAVSGAAPVAMHGASTIKNWVAPGRKVPPELARQVGRLKKEGVPLTAGQQTGSERLRRMEANLGGAAAENILEDQGEAFTRAALQRIGVDASRATPEVIDAATTRIGQQFDALASRNQLVPDQSFVEDIAAAVRDYEGRVPASAIVPQVRKLATDIFQSARTGMTGDVYQSFRSRIGKLARRAARDPELSFAYNSLNDALDDAMERSIGANNPADLGAWQAARSQYRNLLVIERAATAPGSDTALGIISPSQLRNATISLQGRRNYARGQGEFADLARSGEGVMKPLPNPGTAPAISSYLPGGISGTGGALGGGAAGTALFGPAGTLPGAAVGMMTPKAAGAALMSRPVQNTLAGNPPIRKELVQALIRSGAVPASPKGGRWLVGPR